MDRVKAYQKRGGTGISLLPRIAISALALQLAQPLLAQPAEAFEIFGWKFFEPEDDSEPIADPATFAPVFAVNGDDDDLRKKLEAASVLLADKDRPVSGSLGILSKARSEREQLVAALYRDARYDGVIEILIDGTPLDDLPPDAELDISRPVPISVTVDPGQRFSLGAVSLAGDAAGLEPAEFGLVPGGEAGSETVIAAENKIVARLKEDGHPLARIDRRDVIADHNAVALDVTLQVEAGPIAPFGDTRVSGTKDVDAEFTAYMADIERGKTYNPKDLEDARDRLIALEVFGSATVKEAKALDSDGSIPIEIEVSERKMRYFGVGATISNNEGAGIEGYWGHRNLFGRAEKLRIEGSISRIGDPTQLGMMDFKAGFLFEKPGVLGPPSKFVARLKGVFEHPEAYDKFSVNGSVGFVYDLTKQQSVSAEIAVDYSKIDGAFDTEPIDYLIVSLPLQYVYDARNDKLNPTKGFRALVNAEPAVDTLSGAFFTKFRLEGSAYQAVGSDRFVVAGRVATGTIVGAPNSAIPPDRKFYSGGGGSVRGYSYQGVGPKDADGQPIGGRSYAEASLELRIGITEKFGIVPFVDAGTVSVEQFPDFSDVRIGTGVGVRYLTPFGPLRIDAAIPIDRRPGDATFGLYAGIGQAF